MWNEAWAVDAAQWLDCLCLLLTCSAVGSQFRQSPTAASDGDAVQSNRDQCWVLCVGSAGLWDAGVSAQLFYSNVHPLVWCCACCMSSVCVHVMSTGPYPFHPGIPPVVSGCSCLLLGTSLCQGVVQVEELVCTQLYLSRQTILFCRGHVWLGVACTHACQPDCVW